MLRRQMTVRSAVVVRVTSDSLGELRGRKVRLRFTGARAKLYSFYFTTDTQHAAP
jgi:hypothetical protein